MRTRFFRAAIFVVASLFVLSTSFAWEPGAFGMKLKVDGDINSDRNNPLLTSMKVESVEPNSPGERAGIAVGDEIIEVAGLAIFSRRASEILPLTRKQAGESITVKVKRSDGSVFEATMVAVPVNRPN